MNWKNRRKVEQLIEEWDKLDEMNQTIQYREDAFLIGINVPSVSLAEWESINLYSLRSHGIDENRLRDLQEAFLAGLSNAMNDRMKQIEDQVKEL